jgi:energy-coupling factor transporter ATP-binding protein EcfA2
VILRTPGSRQRRQAPRDTAALPLEIQRWFAELSVEESRARLIEAGAGPGVDILLPEIFVDLRLNVIDGNDDDDGLSGVAQVLHAKSFVWRAEDECDATMQPESMLILGGPGEGKSSLTAMCAIIARRSWITDVEALPEELGRRYVRLEATLDASPYSDERHQLDWIPLRIDLPTLARHTAQRGSVSLWAMLAERVERTGEHDEPLERELERVLRGTAPLCWLFDGLDEVPHSDVRTKIIEEIAKLAAMHDRVIVTTRAQTYDDELAGMTEFVVSRVDADTAQQLSRKLVEAWTRGAPVETTTALERLRLAFDRSEVGALACTPLHVTMLSVVALTRELPSNAAVLFESFFDALFRRELNKRVEPEIREADQNILLYLHARVALVLHARGQLPEFSNATLAEQHCRSLLIEAMIAREFDEDLAHRRSDTLLRFSRERLVLLRRTHSDGYGFGVRSFQEYFAARALLDGNDELAKARLLSIALDDYWSNVVRLMACELVRSQDATSMQRAKTVLLGACAAVADWPEEQQLRRRFDARLALHLLEATRTIDAPWVQRRLAEIVVGAMTDEGFDAGDVDSDSWTVTRSQTVHFGLNAALDLAREASTNSSWVPNYTQGLLKAVAHMFNSGFPSKAWHMLMPLLETNNSQASMIATRNEPRSKEECETVLRRFWQSGSATHSNWWRSFVVRRWWWFEPDIHAAIDRHITFSSDKTRVGEIDASERTPTIFGISISGSNARIFSNFAVSFASQRVVVDHAAADSPDVSATWRAIRAIEDFENNRCPDLLAAALRAVAQCPLWQQKRFVDTTHSWPLSASLIWAGNRDRCVRAAELAEQGLLGTNDDWRRFEERIADEVSINVQDLINSDCTEFSPWPSTIATQGVPLTKHLFPDQSRSESPRLCAIGITPLTYQLAQSGIIADFSEEASTQYHREHPWVRRKHEQRKRKALSKPVRDIDLVALDNSALLALRVDSKATNSERERAQAVLLSRIAAPHTEQLRRDSVWHELQLPGMSPERAQRRSTSLAINSIDALSGLRAFARTPEILAALPSHDGSQGQWIVLLGENGTGKTTLLRAIALALLEQDTATKLLTARLRMLRNGESGQVKITVNEAAFECRVHRRADNEEAVETVSNDPLLRPWVVAYGVRRSTALGEPDRSSELRGVANLHSLFELPSALVHAPTWLERQWKLVLSEQAKNRKENLEPEYRGPDERAWNAIGTALERVLGITEIDADGRELYVRHPSFGRVRFEQLSDGYLTTAGWIVDLIARWIAHHEHESLPNDILAHMTGLVLIDEIDLHLHPLWQLRIIDDVRTLFPRLSFVVTTHNPLTVHGARSGEVFVMRREERHDAPSIVVIEQRDVQPGSDIDRVLLDLFDVRDTLDSTTRALLDRHMAVLRRGAAPDDAERVEVEREIRALLGVAGTSLITQRSERVAPSGKVSENANSNAKKWFGGS